MAQFPDDLEQQLRQLRMDGRGLLRMVAPLLVTLLILGALTTGFFKVEANEQSVIRVLGKYKRTVGPGLHFKLPYGIARHDNVAVTEQKKLEFGFRTTVPATRSTFERSGYQDESLMLTGDLNVADVEWVTQYTIKDPVQYLFRVANVNDTFRVMNEAVMREIVGDRTIDEALTVGRSEIEAVGEEKLQVLCDQYELGIAIDKVLLRNVNPPEEVKDSFNEVNTAQQQKETMINAAQSEYNKVIPKARGDAERLIEEARGYAIQQENEALGDVERFNAVFAEYQKAPELTRERLYIQAMTNVLSATKGKVILDANATGVLPLLNLNAARP